MLASNDAAFEIPLALLTISPAKTLGALLVGTFCGLILYGISLQQLYRYLLQFTDDDRYVQVIVFIVMLSETVHCISTMHVAYFTAVSTLTQKKEMYVHGLWSPSAVTVASAPIFLTSQMFFARRVWLIGPRYRLIIGIAIVVLLTEFGFAVALAYKRQFSRKILYVEVLIKSSVTVAVAIEMGGFRWLITTGLSIAFAADLLFTPTLAVASWRSRRGHQGNHGIADLFNTYVVNTGLLHCIFNGAAAITCGTTSKYSLAFDIPQTIAIRLHANSLLSALNSRDLQKAPSIFDSGSYGRNLIQRMNRRAAAETWHTPQVPREEPPVIHVGVTTENELEGTVRDSVFKRGLAVA